MDPETERDPPVDSEPESGREKGDQEKHACKELINQGESSLSPFQSEETRILTDSPVRKVKRTRLSRQNKIKMRQNKVSENSRRSANVNES